MLLDLWYNQSRASLRGEDTAIISMLYGIIVSMY